MAAYIKQLDPRHMVASGGEGHGFIQTGPGQGIQFARDNEGVGNAPYLIQDVPNVDFFTYHPYPNAPWAHFTATQTRDLVRALTQIAVRMGKPAVMEEYGMDRQQPVYDLSGRLVQPTDQSFDSVRAQWYQFMLDDVYNNGGAGSNVWMLADWHDNNYNICFYLPQTDVARDVPIANFLAQEALRVRSGTKT